MTFGHDFCLPAQIPLELLVTIGQFCELDNIVFMDYNYLRTSGSVIYVYQG